MQILQNAKQKKELIDLLMAGFQENKIVVVTHQIPDNKKKVRHGGFNDRRRNKKNIKYP